MSERLLEVLQKYWGYSAFRPLQEEAMSNVLNRRDTLVVLPTGGGKSLCYQVPAAVLDGVAVVISPLLSLMKDQIDALRQCGLTAGCLNSSQTPKEQAETIRLLRAGELKLLYVAPERLASSGFISIMQEVKPSFFAIDEAHCISSWGHDFRPDYLKLAILRDLFPQAPITALTATATLRVRADIARQLNLRDPEVLVGSFDRPNLTYRVERRTNEWVQYCEVIDRHKNESGIIYCISKRKVDELTAALRHAGYKALPYHAGMDGADRRRNQDAFIRDEVDIIVATVAFGMGIDKSNVRYVMHAQSPKTIENYQQEAGRAGRDGLASECILLWSKSDFALWRRILRELEDDARATAEAKLSQLSRYCEESVCRHKALVQYFGQAHDKGNCGACDHCLGGTKTKPTPHVRTLGRRVATTDPLTISQKILSCVVRLAGSYPIGYVGRVLVGSKDRRIAEYQHDTLSTYGILRSEDRSVVRDWIGQLVDQEFLIMTENGELASVTEKGRQVLRGEVTPSLVRSEGESDPRLFEQLRVLRRQIADERNVAAFIIFSDAVLHEMAARRPSTTAAFARISGVGENKALQYGRRFVECITSWCNAMDMPLDIRSTSSGKLRSAITTAPVNNFVERHAYELFRRGNSIDDVVVTLKRARSTVVEYLTNYIQCERIHDATPWVGADTVARIEDAADRAGAERLKPVYDMLGGSVDYETIKIVLRCLRNASERECLVDPARPCA